MKPIWHRFTHHPFVQGLGDGTLPLKNFKDYLVQDYLYLVSLHVHCCLDAMEHKLTCQYRSISQEAMPLLRTKLAQ